MADSVVTEINAAPACRGGVATRSESPFGDAVRAGYVACDRARESEDHEVGRDDNDSMRSWDIGRSVSIRRWVLLLTWTCYPANS